MNVCEMKPLPGEVSTDIGHVGRTPMGCSDECMICEHADNMHCARGADCLAARGESGASIGEWIDEDPDTCYPKMGSAYVFVFASLPGLFFCEDCAIDMEAVE